MDLVHSLEAYPTALVGSMLARRLGTPHVVTAHGTYGILAHKRFVDRLAYRRVLRHAAAVCPVSDGTARQMERLFPDVPTRPILNGNSFCQSIPPIDRTEPERPTVLSVSAVKPRKGHHIGLRAFARVKQRVPDARYWIVGSLSNTRYVEELRSLIAREDIRDVEFLGRIPEDELRRRYREASVFLLSAQQVGYHFEGFGLVCLEASAFGLPVVGTRTGGVPDAIRHGETGLVVEPEDVDRMAGALVRFLTDGKLASNFGRAGRRWAESLTWERNAAQYWRVYGEIAGGEPARKEMTCAGRA
jgi:phosphatidylinositol alpha-1,6-mannosyltransferase